MHSFLLPFSDKVTDKVSDLEFSFKSFGFKFNELFIAISTPPPFSLNFLGLLGSGGCVSLVRSSRNKV